MCALVTGVQTCALPISDRLDRRLRPVGATVPEHIDADMRVAEVGIAVRRHHQPEEQVPLQLLQPGRAGVVELPADDVVDADRDQQRQHDECRDDAGRSEEHTSELQSLMRISYAVFCLKKKTKNDKETKNTEQHNDN